MGEAMAGLIFEHHAAGHSENVGLLPGAGDAEGSLALSHIALPVLLEFEPDLLVVAVGFGGLAIPTPETKA